MDFFTAAPSLYSRYKANGRGNKKHTRRQTSLMSHRMHDVIRSYVNRYDQDGYYQLKSDSLIKHISMIITPIMTMILTKYNEDDFHRVMSKKYYDENGYLCRGFDFIGDLRKNHPLAFSVGLGYARMYKSRLNFDVNVASEIAIDIMTIGWEWHIWPHEKEAIHHLLYRVKKLVQNA